MRMSHEGERTTDSRIQDQPDRAPPHWLNPLGWAISYVLANYEYDSRYRKWPVPKTNQLRPRRRLASVDHRQRSDPKCRPRGDCYRDERTVVINAVAQQKGDQLDRQRESQASPISGRD